MKPLNRVVVTGLGAITPIGNTIEQYWSSLKNGVSGAGPISRFDCSRFKTKFCCEVKGFEPSLYLDSKEICSMDLYAQYAVAAATQAIRSSGLHTTNADKYRYGVIFSSGIGGLGSLQEEIVRFVQKDFNPRFSPHLIIKMISNMAAGIIAMKYDFRGANYGVVSACASSTNAIIEAFNLLRLGKADAIVVGGSEAAINATAIGGFNSLQALSKNNDHPESASRPYDKSRDGFVLGEGAGALVLETLDHAKTRSAPIIAEIAGGGMTADAYHYTLPQPEGRSVYKAMQLAIEEAEMSPDQIDYVNLHATSTPAGDPPELMAVQQLFADSLNTLHVSATKSMTGHLLGAAGAIEAIATILAIKESMIPPTINTEIIDPSINVKVNLTLQKAQQKEVNAAISNTFGFGGQNASVLIRKYREN
ncbi:MAG TPA: beta-ketoacyl-[acyl-carrier-protein] synthase II [Fibrobacteres bacterium]|jgi:3-oxoacyl-[acyl-carrier-protein] synthase II|nr:beta-ketoacyl-[acyl-carrier-protein] synthase II [Fibrobacterota bacterium]